ncbi:ATP-dependent DNA helicase RecG, partial [Paracoccaceae bacterium]|nr:ATP-dependent DNA helicase RecG [Paracoccaceae bacterium]
MVGRPEMLFPLFSSLTNLTGVGSKLSDRFGNLDIKYPKDVLFHVPHSICERSLSNSVLDVNLPSTVTVKIKVINHLPNFIKGKPYRIEVCDEKAKFNLIYFHPRVEWLRNIFPIDRICVVSGKVENFDSVIQMTHPEFVVDEIRISEIPKVEPIYPLTFGISQKVMNKSVKSALRFAP